MKPKPHTIQWIAPHLSEGELRKIYEIIGAEFLDKFTKELRAELHYDSPDEYINGRYQIREILDAARVASGIKDER